MEEARLPKRTHGFRKAFLDRTKRSEDAIAIPKFPLEDIEDAFAYYVGIRGMSEELFWGADISFLREAADNIDAFENWKSYATTRAMSAKRR